MELVARRNPLITTGCTHRVTQVRARRGMMSVWMTLAHAASTNSEPATAAATRPASRTTICFSPDRRRIRLPTREPPDAASSADALAMLRRSATPNIGHLARFWREMLAWDTRNTLNRLIWAPAPSSPIQVRAPEPARDAPPSQAASRSKIKMCSDLVGMAGFEPAASCSQSRRANQAAPHPVEPNVAYRPTCQHPRSCGCSRCGLAASMRWPARHLAAPPTPPNRYAVGAHLVPGA
jgi:hypothetical protein